jgi:hypothetical protein
MKLCFEFISCCYSQQRASYTLFHDKSAWIVFFFRCDVNISVFASLPLALKQRYLKSKKTKPILEKQSSHYLKKFPKFCFWQSAHWWATYKFTHKILVLLIPELFIPGCNIWSLQSWFLHCISDVIKIWKQGQVSTFFLFGTTTYEKVS